MFAQTGFTLPVLGGAKLVYADIRTTPYDQDNSQSYKNN